MLPIIIETGNLMVEGRWMFAYINQNEREKMYPSVTGDFCNWSVRALLLIDEKRLILVDTGIGEKHKRNYFKDYKINGKDTLKKSLRKYGVSSDDITDVVLTHLHFDHCGGSTSFDEHRNIVPSFPNATYYISERQWNYALNPPEKDSDSFINENFLPLRGKAKLNIVEQDCELLPGLHIKMFDGHTPGMMIPYFTYNSKTYVFAGDVIPSLAHIPVDNMMLYEVNPNTSLDEKIRFLNEAAEKNYIIIFQHDLYNECSTVQYYNDIVVAFETFNLSDKTLKQR